MSGRLIASACCLLMLVGCDSSQPKVTTSEPSPSATTAPATPNPHGMPPMASPQGMSPSMGSPHGMSGMGAMGGVAQDAPELGMEVQAGPTIHLTAPQGWVRKRPASSFTLAQFGLPPVEGDTEEAKLTISIVGGGAQANVGRWRGQYPGGQDPTEVVIAGRKVIMVDFSSESEGRLLGAVIATDNPTQHCYVKLTGPAKTLGANADKFKAFIESLGKTAEAPPKDTPAETPADTPAETPAETPTETPAETPADTPAETPADAMEDSP